MHSAGAEAGACTIDTGKPSSSTGSLRTVPLRPSGDYSYLKCGFSGFIGIYRGKHRKSDRDVLMPAWLKCHLVFLLFCLKK